MTKMKPHVKAAWLEALRSGRYKQGKGCLRSGPPEDSDFCCLGVLCDLGERKAWSQAPGYGTWTYVGPDGIPASGYLPLDVMKLAGLTHTAAATLANMNDGDGDLNVPPRSLSEIADWIERYL